MYCSDQAPPHSLKPFLTWQVLKLIDDDMATPGTSLKSSVFDSSASSCLPSAFDLQQQSTQTPLGLNKSLQLLAQLSLPLSDFDNLWQGQLVKTGMVVESAAGVHLVLASSSGGTRALPMKSERVLKMKDGYRTLWGVAWHLAS
jgi:hypothetical protein